MIDKGSLKALTDMINVGYIRLMFTVLFMDYASDEAKEQQESYERYCELKEQEVSGKYPCVDWGFVLGQYRHTPEEKLPIYGMCDDATISLWSKRFPKSAYKAKRNIISILYPFYDEICDENTLTATLVCDSFQGSYNENTEDIDIALKECGFKGIEELNCVK